MFVVLTQSCRSTTASFAESRRFVIVHSRAATMCGHISALTPLCAISSSLYICESCMGSVAQKVSQVMCVVCQWKKWTDSRWAAIGDTSRSFLGAVLLCICDLLSFAIHNGHSTYHMSNFAKLSIALESCRSGFSCIVRQRCCVRHAIIR